MTTERTRIDVVEGDTWQVSVEVRESDGSAYSFTGLSPFLQLRREIGGEVIGELTEGDGLTLDSPQAGDIAVAVPCTLTAGLCRNRRGCSVVGDLELRTADATPVVTTVAALQFDVLPEATRRA